MECSLWREGCSVNGENMRGNLTFRVKNQRGSWTENVQMLNMRVRWWSRESRPSLACTLLQWVEKCSLIDASLKCNLVSKTEISLHLSLICHNYASLGLHNDQFNHFAVWRVITANHDNRFDIWWEPFRAQELLLWASWCYFNLTGIFWLAPIAKPLVTDSFHFNNLCDLAVGLFAHTQGQHVRELSFKMNILSLVIHVKSLSTPIGSYCLGNSKCR